MMDALAWCEDDSESLKEEGLIMAIRAGMNSEEEGQTVTCEQVEELVCTNGSSRGDGK